jgi:hypothetical protein
VNRTFKIVGRFSGAEPRWRLAGKVGRQAKKRVYTSYEDFLRHGPELDRRWQDFCKYDVEHYELIDGKWTKLDFPFRTTSAGNEVDK